MDISELFRVMSPLELTIARRDALFYYGPTNSTPVTNTREVCGQIVADYKLAQEAVIAEQITDHLRIDRKEIAAAARSRAEADLAAAPWEIRALWATWDAVRAPSPEILAIRNFVINGNFDSRS